MARLLGRQPAIPYQISSFCRFGWPAVIRSDCYSSSGEPNPNIYYLLCPYLRHALSRLEDDGMIGTLEALVKADNDIAGDLRKAQEEHRRSWIRSAAEMPEPPPGRMRISSPNIAATSADESLKCLHAHFSWFLMHPDYKLGGVIARKLGQIWCEDELCRQIAREMVDGPGPA
ncbi:MAG: DUF501 domain-containing protein [Thermoleophilia bacterium]